jgi:DNA polymerase
VAAPKLIGLRIDIETRSREDVKVGSYRYAEDPDFAILCTSYAPLRRFAGGAVAMGKPRILQAAERARFTELLLDPGIEKHAYNANFERVCLSRDPVYGVGLPDGEYIDPLNWRCTAVQANLYGVYGRLGDVAKAVRSPINKDNAGKALIRLFSSPDRKTGLYHVFVPRPEKGNPAFICWCGADHYQASRNFESYCDQDVLAEAGVASQFPETPESSQVEYEADQRINDRGFRHHKRLSAMAVKQVEVEKNRVMGELRDLTGINNPNSVQQKSRWLESMGYPMVSLDKAHRESAEADPLCPDDVREALGLMSRASLTSVQKHQAALNTRCRDGRVRGALQYHAAHTGREGGRGMQPQNLPTYEASLHDAARLLHGTAGRDAPQIAKGTVRGTIIPARGHVFVGADYNAVEARTLGGLTAERWVQDEFWHGEGKIYEATAEVMFGVVKALLIEEIKRCGKCGVCVHCLVRGKGKVSNLALGYNGGAGALVTMGAEREGIDCGNYVELNAEWTALGKPGPFWQWESDRHDYPELLRLRDLYRQKSPMTVRFWKLCAQAWDNACEGKTTQFGQNGCLTMMRDGQHNRLVLPSGRSIWYRFAKSHRDPETGRVERRTFIGKGKGVGQQRVDVHGGVLTNNATQGTARDMLFDLILRIEDRTARGWPARLVLHVHDEVLLEVPNKHAERIQQDLTQMMGQSPSWGSIFPLAGNATISQRFGK